MAVKAFVIIPFELTIEEGELTPTMKVIRHFVVDKYEKWIDMLFKPNRYPEEQTCIVRIKEEPSNFDHYGQYITDHS